MVLHVWAALERKSKSGKCTLANCFCYICHTIPLARVHGALIQCAAAGRFDTGQVHGKSTKLTQQNHVASVFLHVPLGAPAPAAASLSPGLTLAAACLLLPCVTGSAETVMRPFALASGIYKRNKGLMGQAAAPGIGIRHACVPVSQACCTCWPLTLIMLGALVLLGPMVLAWLVLSQLLGVVQKVDAAHVEVYMNA